MINFPIYFSNLNEETQKRLLKAVGTEDPSEINWDMDILPIAELEFEDKGGDAMQDTKTGTDIDPKFSVHQ